MVSPEASPVLLGPAATRLADKRCPTASAASFAGSPTRTRPPASTSRYTPQVRTALDDTFSPRELYGRSSCSTFSVRHRSVCFTHRATTASAAGPIRTVRPVPAVLGERRHPRQVHQQIRAQPPLVGGHVLQGLHVPVQRRRRQQVQRRGVVVRHIGLGHDPHVGAPQMRPHRRVGIRRGHRVARAVRSHQVRHERGGLERGRRCSRCGSPAGRPCAGSAGCSCRTRTCPRRPTPRTAGPRPARAGRRRRCRSARRASISPGSATTGLPRRPHRKIRSSYRPASTAADRQSGKSRTGRDPGPKVTARPSVGVAGGACPTRSGSVSRHTHQTAPRPRCQWPGRGSAFGVHESPLQFPRVPARSPLVRVLSCRRAPALTPAHSYSTPSTHILLTPPAARRAPAGPGSPRPAAPGRTASPGRCPRRAAAPSPAARRSPRPRR